MSAQKLSNPNESPLFDKRVLNNQHQSISALITLNRKVSSTQVANKNDTDDWREIVRKRIEAKTKFKRKQPLASAKPTKENVYSECYGYFFFPLLRPYDTYLKIIN